jgi:hypothetical protein
MQLTNHRQHDIQGDEADGDRNVTPAAEGKGGQPTQQVGRLAWRDGQRQLPDAMEELRVVLARNRRTATNAQWLSSPVIEIALPGHQGT